MGSKLLATHFLLLSVLLGSAATSAAKSKVTFRSNPPGATVTDSAMGELGVTPFELNLKRNTALECTFSKRGYESRTVTSTVDALKVEVRGDLPALPATTVRLGVEPRQTMVKLSAADGTEVYSGEGGRVHTLPGDHWGSADIATFHLEAWAPGYRPLEEEIVLTKHEYHDHSISLAELSTILTVSSEPAGVRVSSQFLGDLGITPLETRVALVDLMRARSRQNAEQGNPGRMLLTFSKPGYRSSASQILLDFERAENALNVSLDELAVEAGGSR